MHAWAAWRVYKIACDADGGRDRVFLARMFQKLLLNFTWWVNRKDAAGRNLFSGGFLGLDNIGVFDRSKPLRTGDFLEQADGTAWMAFYCTTMLSMALELAKTDPVYEDMASKFFEHFVHIADAMNSFGGTGLWDEADGFYYDRLHVDGNETALRVRSMVGLLPLIAVEVLDDEVIDRLPAFKKRMRWFLDNRRDLAGLGRARAGGAAAACCWRSPRASAWCACSRGCSTRASSCRHTASARRRRSTRRTPTASTSAGQTLEVDYEPGESKIGLFGGNSNWRGPVWMPPNYLLIEALERYHHFYGDDLRVECPVGSGRGLTLAEVARELSARVAGIFLAGPDGRRPCHGDDALFASDPRWRELLLFHEYFHGETGRGLGASHQTGWTALAVRFIEDLARARRRRDADR